MGVSVGRFSRQKESEIRFNILYAIQELATFSGVDIKTIQGTAPYSMVLSQITSQKIAAELKKLIDSGMVVKSVAKGKTVKYMLRSTYQELMSNGKIKNESFGYGDYRDIPKVKVEEEDESEVICERIKLAANRPKYEPMW